MLPITHRFSLCNATQRAIAAQKQANTITVSVAVYAQLQTVLVQYLRFFVVDGSNTGVPNTCISSRLNSSTYKLHDAAMPLKLASEISSND